MVFLKTFVRKSSDFYAVRDTDKDVNAWLVANAANIKIVDRKVSVTAIGSSERSNGEFFLVVELWYESEQPIEEPTQPDSPKA